MANLTDNAGPLAAGFSGYDNPIVYFIHNSGGQCIGCTHDRLLADQAAIDCGGYISIEYDDNEDDYDRYMDSQENYLGQVELGD